MKSGVSLRCARSILVHTSHYSRLEKTVYTACHPEKTTTYMLHAVPITTHTHVRRKSIRKKETKKRKEEKGKEGRGKEKKGKKIKESEKGKEIK